MSEMKEVKRYTDQEIFDCLDIHHMCRGPYVLASAYDALRAQLPEGMEHCTIKLDTCAKCQRSWLQPTNWVNRGCPHCERDALLSEKAALAAELRQTEQAAAEYHCEVERLRSAIAGARDALLEGANHLGYAADNHYRASTLVKYEAQLRALSSIGDLPAGEEG